MRLKKDSSNQKLRGAYYTPLQLAKAMVGLFAPQDMASVLEPSCGYGVFIDSFDELGLLPNVETLKAIEIEPDEAKKVRNWSLSNISIIPSKDKDMSIPVGCEAIVNLNNNISCFDLDITEIIEEPFMPVPHAHVPIIISFIAFYFLYL